MEDMNDVLSELSSSFQELAQEYPDHMRFFNGFMGIAEKDSILSKRTKELIAIALSVATHCPWCIAYHVNAALSSGATKEAIMEACWVATLMGGGPSLMYTQLVVKALDDFEHGT